MSTSSAARQQEFDFSDSGIVGSPVSRSFTGTTGSADVLRMPRFPSFSYSAETAASRVAGRINAAAISAADHERLLDERQRLLDKQFAGSVTPKEVNRLKYVRWTLDRVDDARYGADLERLEGMIAQYERFKEDIDAFYNELNQVRTSRRR